MNEEMLKAILEIVREGGQGAYALVIVHYVFALVRFALGMSLIYVSIKVVAGLVKGIYKIENLDKDNAKEFAKTW